MLRSGSRSASTNGGRDPASARTGLTAVAPKLGAQPPSHRAASAGGSGGDFEDKYRRVVEENVALKRERNELEAKVKDLKTKFRRLTRDLVPDENGDYVLPGAQHPPPPSQAPQHLPQPLPRPSLTGESPALAAAAAAAHAQAQQVLEGERKRLEQRLAVALSQIDYMARDMERVKTATPAGAASAQLASHMQLLQHQLDAARQTSASDAERIAQLQKERDALHLEIRGLSDRLRQQHDTLAAQVSAVNRSQTLQQSQGQVAAASVSEHLRKQVQELMGDLQKNRDQQLADMQAIDSLTRERDRLRIALKSSEAQLEVARHAAGASALPAGSTAVDNGSLSDLQRALANKSTEMTVLTNRLNFSQTQVEAMKAECERLVDEIKGLNLQHADVKRRMFQLEHEKTSLQLRTEKTADLEAQLSHKSQELLKSEQELLRLVDRLQSCARDTETQVRREMNDRVAELEAMRDRAEQDRRASEREALQGRLENSDLKRHLDNALHDATLFKHEMQRLEAEKRELSDRVAMAGAAGIMDAANVDDEVHRAVALATMRKRVAKAGAALGAADNNGSTGAGAGDILQMWEGMEWSDGKELALIRETLASSALDMELAQARCLQMQTAIAEKNRLLEGISGERDELLTENIELRQRISGVQTALARQQLQRIAHAQAQGLRSSLSVQLNEISCDPVFQQCDDGTLYAPTLFFTVEGLGGYEPVLSETFYSLSADISLQFVFENLDLDEFTLAKLQATTLVLQLHQSLGTESTVVAVATLSGSRLLHCRFDGVFTDHLALHSAEGERMGTVGVTVTAPDLLLPLLLSRPIVSAVTPDSIRAALISLRSVRALRIQVFRADNLPCSPHTGAAPAPYVFYTSTSPHGITFVADTMVVASNRTMTTAPVFDVLPADHVVVLDPEFVRFVSDGVVSFVVFDHKASDIRQNLGIVEVPLRPLLESPTAVIRRTESLHPQGTLEVGLSWVRTCA